jgi:hypothetical protein
MTLPRDCGLDDVKGILIPINRKITPMARILFILPPTNYNAELIYLFNCERGFIYYVVLWMYTGGENK